MTDRDCSRASTEHPSHPTPNNTRPSLRCLSVRSVHLSYHASWQFVPEPRECAWLGFDAAGGDLPWDLPPPQAAGEPDNPKSPPRFPGGAPPAGVGDGPQTVPRTKTATKTLDPVWTDAVTLELPPAE